MLFNFSPGTIQKVFASKEKKNHEIIPRIVSVQFCLPINKIRTEYYLLLVRGPIIHFLIVNINNKLKCRSISKNNHFPEAEIGSFFPLLRRRSVKTIKIFFKKKKNKNQSRRVNPFIAPTEIHFVIKKKLNVGFGRFTYRKIKEKINKYKK